MLDQAPPEVKAMHAAFVEATGYAVSLSYSRAQALWAIVTRDVQPPLGPNDLKAVVRAIKADMRSPRPRFNEASLEFGNLLGDPDVFEDRAMRCRQAAQRRLGAKPKPPVPVTDASGTTRLLPATSAEPAPISRKVIEEMKDFTKRLEGKQ